MSPGCVYPENEQPLGPILLRDDVLEETGHLPPATPDPDMGHDLSDILELRASGPASGNDD